MSYPAFHIKPDQEPTDADWTKVNTWDLPTEKDEFLLAIGGADHLDHFMTLPAAQAMPYELREALGLPLAPREEA